MNDFTKDELEIILLDMNINIRRTTVLTVAKTYFELRDKIQSMIDNYCKHKWAVYRGENNEGYPQCSKCKEIKK